MAAEAKGGGVEEGAEVSAAGIEAEMSVDNRPWAARVAAGGGEETTVEGAAEGTAEGAMEGAVEGAVERAAEVVATGTGGASCMRTCCG